MISFLCSYKLLGYANGSSQPLAPKVTTKQGALTIKIDNPEIQEWQILDQFCLTYFYASVTSDIGLQFSGVDSAALAWAKLKTLFDSQTYAQKEFPK